MHLNYWPNTCSLLQSCGFQSKCSRFFSFQCLNFGIANGAKKMSTHLYLDLYFAGNPRGLSLLLKRILADIWVVSETRIHAETQENFKIPVEKRGKFPKLLNILIHQIMTSKYPWVIFMQLGPFLYHFISFWNFERNMRENFTWKYDGINLGTCISEQPHVHFEAERYEPWNWW